MLFALGVTELRDIFGAEPALAERLRAVSGARFATAAAPEQRRRGPFIGRIGPVLKQPIDPPPIPERPCEWDADALLTARAIAPARLGYAWQVLVAWLAELSWGQLRLDPFTEDDLAKIEFDLACAGLPSPLGLERLLRNDPAVPLRPLPGQRFGYAKHAQVEDARQGLTRVIFDIDQASRPRVGEVLEFLNDFPGWAKSAQRSGRPAPDLIVVWPDARG